MTNKVEIYQTGNDFQKRAYKKMSKYLDQKGVSKYGTPNKGLTPYRHLLPAESTIENFLFNESIYLASQSRFQDHKAGNWDRARTNTVASQPCCFNLFVPLQQDLALTGRLFSSLLGETVVVDHIEIEFTPNTPKLDSLSGFERHADESIGDQGNNQGTDADVAVFYRSKDKKGVILIEFKYIEPDFSPCYSYKKKSKDEMKCATPDFFQHMIEERLSIERGLACGYLKYKNWQSSQSSDLIDIAKVRALSACPFRFSLNQLWRNILLAESVKKARNLDDCYFWVLAPGGNEKLWDNHKEDVEERLRKILTNKGQNKFKKLPLENVIDCLANLDLSSVQQDWMGAFRDKYLFPFS